jgi:DNA-binding NarL/FixJ family response regulator
LLIKEADEKIAQLHGTGSSAPPPLPSLTHAANETTTGPAAGAEADLDGALASAAAAPLAAPLHGEARIDSRHMEIYTLADEGHDSREIARRLSRPLGEIELILALRSRSASVPSA